LADFVLQKKFTIEVAGPFASEAEGRAVETSLISALITKFNVAQGDLNARFRPLGVPAEFAERLSLPPLQRTEFFSAQGNAPMPALFVIVGAKDFDDGREGYDLANPPTDEKVLARVEKWWQLRRYLPDWAKAPDESPGILIGINVSGKAASP
jgi:hypothetical protein